MASEMPVLPLVGSRMVAPGFRDPSFSAASIILIAARSLIDPVGLWSSSLAHSRTSGVGDRFGSPTSGVPPSESIRDEKRAIRVLPGRDGVGRAERGAQQPPATAGRIVTESPSLTWVSRAPVKRTSSSLTSTFTNRCSLPSSVTRRFFRPGCLLSRSSTSAPSVAPLPSMVLLPPVWVRRMVGIRTSMAMACGSPRVFGSGAPRKGGSGASSGANARSPSAIPNSGRASCRGPPRACEHWGQEGPFSVVDDGRRRVAEEVGLDDLDLLLAHLAVHDPEAAELHLITGQAGLRTVVPGGHQHVVGVRLGGQADVGARGMGLGGGVRVVDDHRLLAAVVHLSVELQQVGRVELVEGRGP